MTIPLNAERARVRYAHALYRIALLREPQPARAAKVIVHAFTQLDWNTVTLDDQLEARLVAALPRVRPARWFRRWRNRPQVTLPAAFWKLTPAARTALGLRILRGMATPQIATALGEPVAAVQVTILRAIAQIGGLPYGPLDEACLRCRTARLDEPHAERGHWFGCEACRTEHPAWERAEAALNAQLQRAVGERLLPREADEALTTALARDDQRQMVPVWKQPSMLRIAAVLGVVVVLLALVWPRQAGLISGRGDNLATRQIVEQARAQYGAVPAGTEITHRRWEITVTDPQMLLQAEEWVDPSEPARHRMQLRDGTKSVEWQVGDGYKAMYYMSNLPVAFCGGVLTGLDWHIRERNVWSIPKDEQLRLRTARWQSGAWATGARYLDLALAAASLRSLGVSGKGVEAVLTLAAEGREINGTLLLRLDPLTHELREVRELRQNNGQTQAFVPWRLVFTETLERATALRGAVLNGYPDPTPPKLVERTGPIIDPTCPLLGSEQTIKLPLAIATGQAGRLWGLPRLPPDTEQAYLIGVPASENIIRGDRGNGDGSSRVVYVGKGKRLALSASSAAVQRSQTSTVEAGPWQLTFTTLTQGVSFITLYRSSTTPTSYSEGDGLRVWAQGWSQAELIDLLATVRPLRLNDWATTAPMWYAAQPWDRETQQRFMHILSAIVPVPNQTLRQVTRWTSRQAPFLAELHDPYHLPADEMRSNYRMEEWTQLDAMAIMQRSKHVMLGPKDRVFYAWWQNGQTIYNYDARTNSTRWFTGTMQYLDDTYQVLQLLQERDWRWQTRADGSMTAERTFPLVPNNWSTDEYALEYSMWTNDLPNHQVLLRMSFDRDGTWKSTEQFAVPLAPSSLDNAVLIHQVVSERREWLPSVPDGTFEFTPPIGTRSLGPNDVVPPPAINTLTMPISLTKVAEIVPFPVYRWPDSDLTKLVSVQGPNNWNAAPLEYTYSTIKDAALTGHAVNLMYTSANTSQGYIVVTQGPATPLRKILRENVPFWTKSEQRKFYVGGSLVDGWVMQNDENQLRWVIWEWNDTLFFVQVGDKEIDLDVLIQEFDGMERIEG